MSTNRNQNKKAHLPRHNGRPFDIPRSCLIKALKKKKKKKHSRLTGPELIQCHYKDKNKRTGVSLAVFSRGP